MVRNICIYYKLLYIYIYAFLWPTFSDGLGWPKEKARHRTGVLLRCQKCKITQRQVIYFSPFFLFSFYMSGVLVLNSRVLVYPYFQILCRYRFFFKFLYNQLLNNVVKSKLVGIMLSDTVVGTWIKLNSWNSFIVVVCWFGQHVIAGIVLFLIAFFRGIWWSAWFYIQNMTKDWELSF